MLCTMQSTMHGTMRALTVSRRRLRAPQWTAAACLTSFAWILLDSPQHLMSYDRITLSPTPL
jgi:hypothetical protein